MREEFIPIYEKFINVYGIKSQMRMCIEEMSELTKELCKLERHFGTEKQVQVENNIREELADVLNMAEQLEFYFGTDEIEKIRKQKIDRAIIRDFDNNK